MGEGIATTEVATRPARPEDADFLAWVVLASSRSHLPRGFWDLLIPDDEGLRMEFARQLLLAGRPSWWHWSGFRIAELDGRPAAALSGFDAEDPRFVSPNDAVMAAVAASDWNANRVRTAFARGAPFFTCLHEPVPGAWIVESVATRPEARGRGLAHALLCEVLEAGRRAGHPVAQLSLLIGNAPAQRAYERVGFTISAEKRDPVFEATLGCPGIARMTVRL